MDIGTWQLLQRSDSVQVHQILHTLSYGDAVSNEVIEIRRALRKMGYHSEIFAINSHPKVSKFCKHIKEYKKSVNNVVLYHLSIASLEVTEFVRLLPDTKILIYHNITPHNYFRNVNDELYYLCKKGREELKTLNETVKLALGDSEYNRNELTNNGFKNTDILPILIDYSIYKSSSNLEIMKKYEDDFINLLFVGRVAPNKKQEDLIKTFYYYKRINPKSRLFIVGSYEGMEKYFMQLKDIVERLSLADVIFTGQTSLNEIITYYKLADVFICMSEHEGFCVPLLESMCFNVPIIAYNSTAIPYTLSNCGILVNEKRYDEIAEMIDLLVNDDKLRTNVVNGQVQRLKDFEMSKIEIQLKEHISSVINSRNV